MEYSSSVYLITNDNGEFLHRVRNSDCVWRNDIRPYTVCQYKHIDSATRTISRHGIEGRPIKANISFAPLPVPEAQG